MPPPRRDSLVDRVLGVWNTKCNLCKQFAFTLAEVLITLGIIGVVAALTMPSLIANHREKETVAKLKKAYSTLSNAFLSAKEEYGTPDEWELIDANSQTGAENLAGKFAEYMNVSKYCGTGSGCCADVYYKYINGNSSTQFDSSTSYAKLILTNGTSIMFGVRSADCTATRGDMPLLKNLCASIYVDTNGKRLPNQLGYDTFSFLLSKEGIIPQGTPSDTYHSFDIYCKKSSSGGHGCSAWVIYNGNQDYLHCSDLSWDGKTKCK